MYAIVEIAGQQFKVEKDQQIYVHRLEGKEGDKVQFDDVLLIDNDGKVTVGAPAINGAAIEAKILQHLKDDKVTVFKKKRRKGYKVKRGHRQLLTAIQIAKILEKGAKKSSPARAKASAPKKATEKKAEAKSGDAKKTTSSAKKSSTTAKKSTSTADKSATKKTTAKKTTTAKKSSTGAKKAPAKKSTTAKKSETKSAKPAAKKPATKKAAPKKKDEDKKDDKK